MDSHRDFFSDAEPVETQVTIILSLESMVVQLGAERRIIDNPVGRKRDAHLIAARGYYKTLQEMGIPVNIKHMHDYSWEEESGAPRLAIIPHATAVTWEQCAAIEKFVKNGNTLLVSGLTGIYDEYGKFIPTDNFINQAYFRDDYIRIGKEYPWDDILGGKLKEIRFIDEYFQIELTPSHITLPSHLWTGTIDNTNGRVLGKYLGYDIAIQSQTGKGKSIWIPSPIGIGAWEKDNLALSDFLRFYLNDFLEQTPFSFSRKYEDCVLRILKNQDRYLTVVTNGSALPKECMLIVDDESMEPSLIWGDDKQVAMKGRKINLGPRETVVLLWE
jgi:beta-galactosidase